MYKNLKKRAKRLLLPLPTIYYCLAYLWRRILLKTTFVAITGSAGKTTAKNCIASILQQQGATISTKGTRNTLRGDLLPKTILRVRPWHRYAVIEVGVGKPGAMDKCASLVKPDICLILRVGANHLKEFKNLETVAHEKANLVRRLTKQNIALLNGDDPLVMQMTSDTKAAVKTFGTSKKFHVCADEVESKWPHRLSFNLHSESESRHVRTQFLGIHWISSVLGAFAVAEACDIPLKNSIHPIASTKPYWARMQPIEMPNGATFIRDDWNGSVDAYKVAFDFLSEAKAPRKVFVSSSNLTDTNKKSKVQANFLGRNAAEAADMAIFVGQYAQQAKGNAVHFGMPPENAYGFSEWQSAADLIRKEIGQGDVVLLKGRTCDHLTRIYLSLIGSVKCQLTYCAKTMLCDHCPELGFEWDQSLNGLMAKPLNNFNTNP